METTEVWKSKTDSRSIDVCVQKDEIAKVVLMSIVWYFGAAMTKNHGREYSRLILRLQGGHTGLFSKKESAKELGRGHHDLT